VRHAKRRDNLIGLIHEVGQCFLWFHPLVWITSSRLALYRELSCDESVTLRAHSADLVSALAKLASPEHASLLQATASSFISQRVARLTSDQSESPHYAANILLAITFAAVLMAAVVGPMAEAAAAYACALTHGLAR
jgi:beta-lactamase regulating signal transducer with metallopeptidase domain